MRQLAVLLVFAAVVSHGCFGGTDLSDEIRDWLQAFYISSASSARGDLVMFWASVEDKYIVPRDHRPNADRRAFMFRIIGLPGDRIRIEKGDVYINGQREPVAPVGGPGDLEGQLVQLYRVAGPQRTYMIARAGNSDPQPFPEFNVEPDRYFVLGDNRDRAYDSRYWGTVHRSHIFGKAWLIYFSTEPGTLWLRPSRFFLWLNEDVADDSPEAGRSAR